MNEQTIRACFESNADLECVVYNVFEPDFDKWVKCKDIEKCPCHIDRDNSIDNTVFATYEMRMLLCIKDHGNSGTLTLNDWEVQFIRDMLKKTIFTDKQIAIVKKIYGRIKDE